MVHGERRAREQSYCKTVNGSEIYVVPRELVRRKAQPLALAALC